MASIVKRGKSYSVVYMKEIGGKRKQRWETYHSKEEALHRKETLDCFWRLKKERIEIEIETVAQLMGEYVRLYGLSKWSLSMYESCCGLIKNYIVPHFGCIKLDELSPRLVSKLYRDFLDKQRYSGQFHKNEGKNVTPCTLNSIHKLLHSAFEQAVLWEYVQRNPFHKAVLPKIDYKPQLFLTARQVDNALKHCENLFLKLAMELAFVCTLRGGELLALTWQDVDWQHNSLRIDKTLCRVSRKAVLALNKRGIQHMFPTGKDTNTVMVLKSPKTQSSNRIVYFPASVRQVLIAWQNEQKNSVDCDLPYLVFAYGDGRPMQCETLRKVVMDEAMEGLVESIKQNGVLNRIIIRPRRKGGYEIIAGHRRTEASRIAGLTSIPADLRRDMDDDAATIAMIETNLKQRPKLLPSERALAYRLMRDTLAHQGIAPESDEDKRKHTKVQIAECYGESARQVARFIRLSYLNQPLLELVDQGRLQMGVAVQISYLDTEAQCWITEHYVRSDELPTANQMKELRRLYNDGALTQAVFDELMMQEKPPKPTKADFISRIREEHFPDLTDDDVMKKLIELVEGYRRKQSLGL